MLLRDPDETAENDRRSDFFDGSASGLSRLKIIT
jgi:hypothetical protein